MRRTIVGAQVIMTPWVTRLVIANAIIFVLSLAAPAMTEAFMFVPVAALLRPWTCVTYMFLHAGFMHIFFNMLALFFFGPRLEMELGGKHFIALYFVSGIAGALLSFVTPFTAIIGASGAVYGVMLGFAYFWPREPIHIWGILPVESRWFIVMMTALSLLGGFGGGGGVAHFAHLGGFLGGFLYLRLVKREKVGGGTLPAVAVSLPTLVAPARWSKIDRVRLHPVNREEFDRIRSKIDALGVSSLTPVEIGFLDRFSPEE